MTQQWGQKWDLAWWHLLPGDQGGIWGKSRVPPLPEQLWLTNPPLPTKNHAGSNPLHHFFYRVTFLLLFFLAGIFLFFYFFSSCRLKVVGRLQAHALQLRLTSAPFFFPYRDGFFICLFIFFLAHFKPELPRRSAPDAP